VSSLFTPTSLGEIDVFPTANGKGGVGTPGMETDAQEAGWRAVAQAVHDAGGRIGQLRRRRPPRG
jgi:2,4-dienoyl-CoA reductase-like NADH-dependent reductase (Old Yellow Enzyme family)